jgi:hypothetical protein
MTKRNWVQLLRRTVLILFLILFAVCQEWLVREDNALAYQLQNQESKLDRGMFLLNSYNHFRLFS